MCKKKQKESAGERVREKTTHREKPKERKRQGEKVAEAGIETHRRGEGIREDGQGAALQGAFDSRKNY